MGTFYYSSVKGKPTPEKIESAMREICTALFGDALRVDRVDGVPISRGDDRKAMWAFMDDQPRGGDCAFSISLLRDGRLEFKVPRSLWDADWKKQQQIRRRLVRRFNNAA